MNSPDARQPLFKYDGKIGELYWIFIKNLLLKIITLGIYRFWAVSRLRRYVWSRLQFQGERFEYTGTGGELFKGFLLALGALIGAVIAAAIASVVLTRLTHNALLAALPLIALYLFVLVCAAGAFFSAQRYRLSRTVWCGIRGGMSGSALKYGLYVLLYSLLILVTLGQMAPWVTLRLAERRINASGFGSEPFAFQGRAGMLYLAFLGTFVAVLAWVVVLGAGMLRGPMVAVMAHPGQVVPGSPAWTHVMLSVAAFYVLAIVGILLIRCFYIALVVRHVIGNTTLGHRLRFSSSITAVRFLLLVLGNLAIVVLTLGLGFPIVVHRGLRFTADTVWVEGNIDAQQLGQSSQLAPRTGEGMLNLLDHGGAF